MYTPIYDDYDLSQIDSIVKELKNSQNKSNRHKAALAVSNENTGNEAKKFPTKSFYLTAKYAFGKTHDCYFPNSIHALLFPNKPHIKRNFCSNDANISLAYKVTMARSLPYGTSGSTTPDAKIVRITIDKDTHGAGIHINNQLEWTRTMLPWETFNPWVIDYSTSAIAQNYSFLIKVNNDKTEILSTFPMSNEDAQYKHSETSGFTFGISGEIGAGDGTGATGPKGSIGASASWTQSSSLEYDSRDYAINVSNASDRSVTFTWQREEYSKVDDLRSIYSSGSGDYTYPLDRARIAPIAYKSFAPNFDVIYKAEPKTTGETEFTIESSIQLHPLYISAATHILWFSWEGIEAKYLWKTISKPVSFTVNWDDPVFLGGRPVNLRPGAFNDQCIAVDDKLNLALETCDEESIHQSFIYDEKRRYISAFNTNYCLNGSNPVTLVECSKSPLSAKWQWDGDSSIEHLIEQYHGKKLAVDPTTKAIITASKDIPGKSNTRILTEYQKLFGK